MNLARKRFSIILVTYNVENYVDEAIKSVLDQDFKNYELIIVDDCSTDDTVKKIKKYESKGAKIYSTKHNTGTAGGARNVGLKHAKGEYILFLDGDDRVYDKDVLKKIDQLIGNEYYDLLYLGYQDLGNENKVRISNKENSTKEARLICDVSFSVSSRCWNKKFIENNKMRFTEGMYYEDELFCIKATILANKVHSGEFPIFKYRRNRKGSVMSTPSIKKCSDWYRMLGCVVDLLNITPEEYKPYLLSFIKNESDSLPARVKAILKALGEESKIPVFPKRNYDFINFMEEDKSNAN